jgi:hypothetical protein
VKGRSSLTVVIQEADSEPLEEEKPTVPAPPIKTGELKKVVTKGDFRKKKPKNDLNKKPKISKEEKEKEKEEKRLEKIKKRELKRELKRKQKEEERLQRRLKKVGRVNY